MFFFVKTRSRRPTFHADMTAGERTLLEQHVAYWSAQAALGIAIAFGPVLDPAGSYGAGIYRVTDEAELRRLIEQDPAKSLLEFEVLPMARAVVAGG